MASRDEIKALGLLDDAWVLDEAAKIMRRRTSKPAGISRALYCRTLRIEASQCRVEADRVRGVAKAVDDG